MESKWQQVFSVALSILADLSSSVLWTVTIFPGILYLTLFSVFFLGGGVFCFFEVSVRVIIFLVLEIFLHQLEQVVFHGSLRDSKSPLVSRGILTALNNAAIFMVSIFPLSSNPSNLLSNLLGTVPSAPTTNHRHFYIPHTFQFSSKVKLFVYGFAFLYFHSAFHCNSKIH